MEPIVIPLHDRRARFAERLDLVGHAAAALGLLSAAADPASARPLLGVVSLAVAAGLVFAIVREVRHKKADDEATARVGWLNLAAAAVLLTQWAAERMAGGKLVSPELLSAVVAGGLAFLHPVIQRRRCARRCLRMDDAHVTLSTGPFRRYRFAWSELSGVEATPGALRFRMADGAVRDVRMRFVANRTEIHAALVAGMERVSAERMPAGQMPTLAEVS